MTIVNKIIELFTRHGARAYHGENVSQTEHALQAADLAVRDGAPDPLVVAALLHDVGHLLEGQDEDLADHGVDGFHELAAYQWLAKDLGQEVLEPIRLHVEAKRYLCAVDSHYLESLSPASRRSLELQGGPMPAEERACFEANPFYREAIRLRRYDDTAKVPGLDVPDLEHYRSRLEAAVLATDRHASSPARMPNGAPAD